ncbi:uncharacterized protein LOC127104732 [Lathyrus oleraceus]|uniref:Nodule-specific Glycine Rich Peptide n=1 Tax=Pisum sativum TaxID=3888 RepID=A0A9D4VYD3_PEA|nr:uncharacterized protein LOC127104732 [Pisum sativum]KAI5391698.1 hypothetical protein KIW84_076488 [Pisum sativum]
MKTKLFIFVFFLCALIIISVVAIEPSKEGGAIEEIKTNIGIHERVVWSRSWTSWKSRGAPVEGVGGGKSGGLVSGGTGSGGDAKSVTEQNESGKDKGSEPMEEEADKI